METEQKVSTLVQAAIVHAAIDEAVLDDALTETHRRRHWVFDIQEPINPMNGRACGGAFATLDLENPIDLSKLW